MRALNLALVFAMGAGAYNYWRKQQAATDGAGEGRSTAGSPSGFVVLPAARGHRASQVVVLAPEDCPHEDARRADRLAEDLSRKGVPVVRVQTIDFDVTNGASGDVARIHRVMNDTLPIVFVRGKAKANPTLDEVVSEFNRPDRH